MQDEIVYLNGNKGLCHEFQILEYPKAQFKKHILLCQHSNWLYILWESNLIPKVNVKFMLLDIRLLNWPREWGYFAAFFLNPF